MAVTEDGGQSWRLIDTKNQDGNSLYSSFQSPTLWFNTAGQWPNETRRMDAIRHTRQTGEDLVYDVSPFLQVHQSADGASMRLRQKPGVKDAKAMERLREDAIDEAMLTADADEDAPIDAWVALILRSTDGGVTWTRQFSNSTFYFVQVECASSTVCYAVGMNYW
jgi:hypothetical protein